METSNNTENKVIKETEHKEIDQEKVDRLVLFIDKARAVTDILMELSREADEFKEINSNMGDELIVAGRAVDASVEGAIKCYLAITEKPFGTSFTPSASGDVK